MKGNQKVIGILNSLLTGELSAADQYFVHSEIYEDIGLPELHERLSHEMEEELEHARKLIKRILFLEGKPDVASRVKLNVCNDVPSMLKSDLVLELSVVDALKNAINICEEEADYQSRKILMELLEDTEEDHTYWLEKQLGLIDKVGLPNYLQSKMG